MKIIDFLPRSALCADLKAVTKAGALEEMVDLLIGSKKLPSQNRSAVVQALLEREALGSTGIGCGVAIPHAKFSGLQQIIGALAISKRGIPFEAQDGQPAKIFFLLLAPPDSAGLHLKALAKISRLLKDPHLRQNLQNAASEEQVWADIQREDQ
ncbi:MAG: PTS sugar transporter subunit IIA [Elusimicrobia bacterium]|nr:PTS sugar transporter subunit IIA [Elusimicrobiota bacterium]